MFNNPGFNLKKNKRLCRLVPASIPATFFRCEAGGKNTGAVADLSSAIQFSLRL